MEAITWKSIAQNGKSFGKNMREKSYLLDLISFYDGVIHLIDQGKPTDTMFFQ